MVYMYHSLLIHSSAEGHLGCFHVLAIILFIQLLLVMSMIEGKNDVLMSFEIIGYSCEVI